MLFFKERVCGNLSWSFQLLIVEFLVTFHCLFDLPLHFGSSHEVRFFVSCSSNGCVTVS
jgi:hypothetical protein